MKTIALVTGASSGIGREFVMQIDKFGLDEIWGISLNLEALNEVKKSTKTTFVPFCLDLTKVKNIEELNKTLQKEPINIKYLINCSGFGKFGSYKQTKNIDVVDMINLNCTAIVLMCNICLPFMKKHAKIINMASTAGFQPLPYFNVYAATKAFVINYSEALYYELYSRNISVTAVCPGWVKTPFLQKMATKNNDIKKFSYMYDAGDVCSRALKCANKNKLLALYGFKTRVQKFVVNLVPKKLCMKVWLKSQKININKN